MELYDVVPAEKQGLDQENLSNRKKSSPSPNRRNLCSREEGTQLFKVPMQEKHPQANNWRNLPSTLLLYQTPPLCYTSKIYIPHDIMNRMTITARA